MTKAIDARSVSITGRRVLFDTNIWLLLNGYSNADRRRTEIYSLAHKLLLQNGNTIIVNDYVLGEYCNRSCKIDYELAKSESENPSEFPSFKKYRKSQDFVSVMESIRDTCLNLVDDCEFVPVGGGHYRVTDILSRFCGGELDFSDLILSDFCSSEGLVLMTDDADFAECNFEIITANRRLLQRS